jgi:hypothetical protein
LSALRAQCAQGSQFDPVFHLRIEVCMDRLAQILNARNRIGAREL